MRRWLNGRPPSPAVFLQVTHEVTGIAQGQPVLIIALQGEKEQVLVPGTCVPLIPISEEDVEGGA